jgi:hypothetical protein
MSKTYTFKQQIAAFTNGEPDLDSCSYFYDWFCKDKSLKLKAKGLFAKAIWFAKVMKIDTDKTYLWFKNNCPCVVKLYDDFRIADLETGDVLYTVVPSLGYDSKRGEAEVWSFKNGFEEPLFAAESWKLLKKSLSN